MKTKRPRIYLAGRMNRSIAFHAQWREDITAFLVKLGFVVLNPYKLEPLQLKGLRPNRLPKGYKHWCELGDSNDPNLIERFKKYGRRIVRFDSDLVKKEAAIVVVLWDDDCATGAGTHYEVTTAFIHNKTTYMVDMTKETEAPLWIRFCVDEVFKSFDDLKKYLMEEYGSGDEKNIPISEEIDTDDSKEISTGSKVQS